MPISSLPIPALAMTAILGIPSAIYIYYSIFPRKGRLNVPHPKAAPFLGNIPDVVSNIHRYNDLFYEYTLAHGSTWQLVGAIFQSTPILMTVDPLVVEHVLKTNFNNYIKGPDYEKLMPLLGHGIFNTDGESWKVQRKVSSNIFTGRNFRDVVSKAMAEELHILVNILIEKAKSGETVDMYSYLHNFTMDTFGKIGFGVELNTLKGEEVAFPRSFDAANGIITLRFSNPIWKITEWLNGRDKVLRKHIDIIDKFAYENIKKKREIRENGGSPTSPSGYKDLLDLFLDARMDGERLTDVQLRDMVLNMMIAGRDTTAQALSWGLYVLSGRKEIVVEIRKELAEITNGEFPTYDEVATLKYTNAVFLEVLRLYPSVPSDFKCAVDDDVLPGGVLIPKGTEINWMPYAMGRMTSLWGEDALEFKPERWIDEEGKVKRESPFKFTAFQPGPRQMAMVEGVMTLAVLCHLFDFDLAPDADVKTGVSLTLSMLNGLKMKLRLAPKV
ncbi:hypothetical protein HDU97_004157 [Phlyctochytrium planicorne]|nr:hypothetical protein HDU97_004157 [Phlyctochytrium planicorne]